MGGLGLALAALARAVWAVLCDRLALLFVSAVLASWLYQWGCT